MVEFQSSFKASTKNPSRREEPIAVGNERPFAIVTPTYWRDLARCELLAESLDRCAPNVPHYLIVDSRDRKTFAHLVRGQRTLIESESLLDQRFLALTGKIGIVDQSPNSARKRVDNATNKEDCSY